MTGLEHIHGGDLTGACDRYGLDLSEIADFSANINPLGPPPAVFRELARSMDLIRHYPEPRCKKLKLALSSYLGVPPECLIIGNGSSELIYLLVREVNCRRALTLAPVFSEYGLAVLSVGGEVREVSLNPGDGFALPVDEVIRGLPGCELAFFCNPNNPTGRLEQRVEMERIIKSAKHSGTLVAIDEAFMDFIPDRDDYTLLYRAAGREGPAVLYSLTKFFGIPGLRLGAMVAPPELISKLEAARDPWSVNIMAQVAGEVALQEVAYARETRQLVQRERRFLESEISRLQGIKVFPGAANYLLLDIRGTGLTSSVLTGKMGAMGILVRDCSSFTGLGQGYIRIAVRLREENRRLLAGLQKVTGGI
jgi:threonine-phosphate decarboxylase